MIHSCANKENSIRFSTNKEFLAFFFGNHEEFKMIAFVVVVEQYVFLDHMAFDVLCMCDLSCLGRSE